MSVSGALFIVLYLQTISSSACRECDRKRANVQDQRTTTGKQQQQHELSTNGKNLLRTDVPGRFVDVTFKSSPAISGSDIALVCDLGQDEHIPTLSRDFHPDHRNVSHHQLYVQSACSQPSSRRGIGPPITGHCRPGHTYYMFSEIGDYILSSATVFSEPQTVIQIYLTWTEVKQRIEIYRLTYNHEEDCQVHHTKSGGNFVTTLPNFDCPWAAAVPSPSGGHIALMHHFSSANDPYKLTVEILAVGYGYIPCIVKKELDFFEVRVEPDIVYHWIDNDTFRVYGGSNAHEISVDEHAAKPIPFNRRAQTLPKTSSGRVSHDGNTMLILDRQDGYEPKEVPNKHEKPFGTKLN